MLIAIQMSIMSGLTPPDLTLFLTLLPDVNQMSMMSGLTPLVRSLLWIEYVPISCD